jgi:hypothetical protein
VVLPVLDAAIQLGQREHRNIQLFSEPLQTPGNLRHLFLPAVTPVIRLNQLQVVDADETNPLPLFEAAGGSGIFESQPFGRYYTDIVAMGNHVANDFRSAGRNWGGVMMGLDSQDTLL